MSIAITNDQNYSNIAAAIRAKLGVQTEYKPSEMAGAITSIPSGGGGSLTSHNFTSSEGTKTLDRTGSIGDMTFSFNSADSPTAQYYFATVECCGTGVGGLKVFYSAFVILNAQFQKVGEYAETTRRYKRRCGNKHYQFFGKHHFKHNASISRG